MTLVRAGERGVDFSFARPPAQRLLELGFTFIVGYISVPPASPAKNITKAECDAYLAAGLKVLLVWEMDAARPNKGATYGAMDGKAAAGRAAALGYPTDVPILSAADLNTIAANIDQHEAYMRAFATNCTPWTMGEYADVDLLARTVGIWRIGWVPLGAWAWSGTSKADAQRKAGAVGAHVLQHKGYYIDNIWAVDPNDAIADFPAWGATSDPFPPPVPQPPQGDDVNSLLIPTDDPIGAQFYAQTTNQVALSCRWTGPGDNGGKNDKALAAHKAAGLVSQNVKVVDFLHIALDGPLPPGWTASQFRNTDEILERDAKAGTVDQVAREMANHANNEASHANEAVTRIAGTISDIRMGGQRIADAGGH